MCVHTFTSLTTNLIIPGVDYLQNPRTCWSALGCHDACQLCWGSHKFWRGSKKASCIRLSTSTPISQLCLSSFCLSRLHLPHFQLFTSHFHPRSLFRPHLSDSLFSSLPLCSPCPSISSPSFIPSPRAIYSFPSLLYLSHSSHSLFLCLYCFLTIALLQTVQGFLQAVPQRCLGAGEWSHSGTTSVFKTQKLMKRQSACGVTLTI